MRWVAQWGAFASLVWLVVFVLGRDPEAIRGPGKVDCGTQGVDVVFTWVRSFLPRFLRTASLNPNKTPNKTTQVNGSDALHVERRREVLKEAREEGGDNEGRFRDYDTLRYAMRSVMQHFEALRHIHLVIADGEALPVWLDVEASGGTVRVVRHSQIMPRDALPTFNSNAIEANLHLIPGLSQCFAYLNDDMLYGRKISLSLDWNAVRKVQKVHFGVWKAPMAEFVDSNTWHQAIALNNDRLNEHYGVGKMERLYPMHGCYFFHRPTFAHMRSILGDSWDKTLRTRLRSNKDNVISFIYPHVAVAEFEAEPAPLQLHFMNLSPDPRKNIDALRAIVKRRPQCICINDGLEDVGNAPWALTELQMALELMFPHAAPWERKDMIPDFKGRLWPKYFEGPQLTDWILRLAIGVPLGVICLIVCVCCIGECVYRVKAGKASSAY